MRIGIGSYTYTWAIGVPGYSWPKKPLTAEGLLSKARALGVSVVQIADNLPLHELNLTELNSLRRSADELGITIEIGTSGFETPHLLKYLEIAKVLDAKLLMTFLENSFTPIEQVRTKIEQVLPQFVEAGVSIAIQNNEHHSREDLTTLIQEVNNPFVGVCLDPANSIGVLQCPDSVIAGLAPYTISYHIKDFTITRFNDRMGFSMKGSPVGEGMLDFPWAFEVLNSFGKKPNLILELWTPFTQSIERTIAIEDDWANRSIKYLTERLKLNQVS
ncbi:MAG: TIM barrel protein [Desulfitobacterium hafniense]|nr:TIM barrel protein [Desulfitobacterium hafniense]